MLRRVDMHQGQGLKVIDSQKTGLRGCPFFPRVREVLSEECYKAEAGPEYVLAAQ